MRASVVFLSLALVGSLQAQDPRFGLSLNLGFPVGDFRTKTYGPTVKVLSSQEEGYDIGLGGQFTLSFPVQQNLAFRLNLSGMSTRGTNTASGYETVNLRHQMYSIGGEFQFFVQNAYRHRGTYFLLGASADFERFDRGFEDDWDYWDSFHSEYTTRKSRMGGTFGIGHTFGGPGGARFTLECAFHKTLSGNDVKRQEPPSTDFLRMGFGFVF